MNYFSQYAPLIELLGLGNYFLRAEMTSFSLESRLWPNFLPFDNLKFMNQPEKSGSYAREKLHVTNLLNQWFENLSENRFLGIDWHDDNQIGTRGMALDSIDFWQQNDFYSKLLRLKVYITQYLLPNGKPHNLLSVQIAQSLIFNTMTFQH